MPSCVRLDLCEVPKKFGNLKSGLPSAGSSANTSKAAKASGLFKRKACKSDSLTMPPLAVLIIEKRMALIDSSLFCTDHIFAYPAAVGDEY